MLKHLLCTLAACAFVVPTAANDFDQWFEDATLRIDYVLSGSHRTQEISLHKRTRLPFWAGRRVHLDQTVFEGNGQVEITDSATGKVLYRQPFSTLFQEWQNTEEATQVRRSFEHTVLLPMPRRTAYIRLTLTDNRRKVSATMQHRLSPADILIARNDAAPKCPIREIRRSGSSAQAIDLVFVAEGYTEAEMPTFFADVDNAVDALFSHAPFSAFRDRFNITAVASPSVKTGVSSPSNGVWQPTPVGSRFDTFYSTRYLMTEQLWQLHDLLAGVPYEHIIILANTPQYGGGGIFNYYMLTSARQEWFRPVVVHEFGHSFAGLADEYYYDDQYEPYYPAGTEPWEWNITTLTDFKSKWADLVTDTTRNTGEVGLYEGGGYQSKGVFRPSADCRMKTNPYPAFCKVCQRALEHAIRFYTEE